MNFVLAPQSPIDFQVACTLTVCIFVTRYINRKIYKIADSGNSNDQMMVHRSGDRLRKNILITANLPHKTGFVFANCKKRGDNLKAPVRPNFSISTGCKF
jgi:hypothetical protein